MGAFNGTGTFVRSYSWVSDASNGINITASRFDTEDDGFAGGLSNCITRDGQGVPISAIPWGGQDLTGVGNFTAASGTISGNWSIGGNVVISGTLSVTAATSLASGSLILDGNGASRFIGYRNIPLTAKVASYQIALSDIGQGVSTNSAITIPANATTAFSIGDVVAIYNNSGSGITITPAGGVTLRLGGSATIGARTLAQRGFCTLLKVGTDEWVALNGGIS